MKSSKQSPDLSFFKRPIFGTVYWTRITIGDGVKQSSELYKLAAKAARKHENPTLPNFSFTESKPEWVLLYDVARKGQITPRIMKNMRRTDLYYLAGHTFPHPALTQPKDRLNDSDDADKRWEEATKLHGNATRAKAELDRRDLFWARSFIILAALVGGFIGLWAKSR